MAAAVPVRACLIDVYETLVTCDFSRHARLIPKAAGVAPEAWNDPFLNLTSPLNDGRLTLAEAYSRTLVTAGGDDDPALVDALVALDARLLRDATVLHADAVPLLTTLRERGVATALVSNCASNTRTLLDDLGLLDLVDVAVLSCEVGAVKPDAGIYRRALEALGASVGAALFIDDQVRYCTGATDLGMAALRIDRTGTGREEDDVAVISSLAEVSEHL